MPHASPRPGGPGGSYPRAVDDVARWAAALEVTYPRPLLSTFRGGMRRLFFLVFATADLRLRLGLERWRRRSAEGRGRGEDDQGAEAGRGEGHDHQARRQPVRPDPLRQGRAGDLPVRQGEVGPKRVLRRVRRRLAARPDPGRATGGGRDRRRPSRYHQAPRRKDAGHLQRAPALLLRPRGAQRGEVPQRAGVRRPLARAGRQGGRPQLSGAGYSPMTLITSRLLRRPSNSV
jgi:hypothetical protein